MLSEQSKIIHWCFSLFDILSCFKTTFRLRASNRFEITLTSQWSDVPIWSSFHPYFLWKSLIYCCSQSGFFCTASALVNQEKLMESSERSTQPVLLVSAFSEKTALTQVEGNIKSRTPEDCGIGLRYLTDLCGFFKAQISLGCTIHCQPEDVWNQCNKQISSW